jgi:hypothetical protein
MLQEKNYIYGSLNFGIVMCNYIHIIFLTWMEMKILNFV